MCVTNRQQLPLLRDAALDAEPTARMGAVLGGALSAGHVATHNHRMAGALLALRAAVFHVFPNRRSLGLSFVFGGHGTDHGMSCVSKWM